MSQFNYKNYFLFKYLSYNRKRNHTQLNNLKFTLLDKTYYNFN